MGRGMVGRSSTRAHERSRVAITVQHWLKLGYFTAAIGEDQPGYWGARRWVSDGPGRQSSWWERDPRPSRGQVYPAHGPQYAVGDQLVIYVKGRGCPAIMGVTTVPRWDPQWVDQKGAMGEGDRWGVVTEIESLVEVPLSQSPQLADLGVAPTSVMRKGHIQLEEWQFARAKSLLGGLEGTPTPTPVGLTTDNVPIEDGEVEGYWVTTPAQMRRAVRRESQLVRDFATSLVAQGDSVQRTRIVPSSDTRAIFSDLVNETRDQLIEAKARGTRNEIRMAIGQLADYGRFVGSRTRRAVLLDARPDPDLMGLLESQGIAAIWRRGQGFEDSDGGAFT
jgi:hypothetical protein